MTEFLPEIAIVRKLPVSFANCLKEYPPLKPINVDLAHKQHEAYVSILTELISNSIQLPADESLPDCCFIEDTAVVIGKRAAISFLGAPERRGEEALIQKTLTELGIETVKINQPGTIDGGDVLFTGRHLFVGLSRRTNEFGAIQLRKIFGENIQVANLKVEGTLHLKSVMSAFDPHTILFADSAAGRLIAAQIETKFPGAYEFVYLPDAVAANILSIGSTIVIQDGFPESEEILVSLALKRGKKVRKVQMSEFVKADGALTCCSILI
jgi:dimethylargininase